MQITNQYNDNYFDIAIVDPPYGIGASNMSYVREVNSIKQSNGNKIRIPKKKYDTADWDKHPISPEQLMEIKRVSKHQIIFGIDFFDVPFDDSGGRILWNKLVPESLSFKGYERAYCSLIDYEMEIKLLWSGMMQAKSLSEPTVQNGNKKKNQKRIHPTEKPKLLYQKLLLEFLPNGGKIIDTHLGSGSHALAVAELGIEYSLVACEISEIYYKSSYKRFKEQNINLKLF